MKKCLVFFGSLFLSVCIHAQLSTVDSNTLRTISDNWVATDNLNRDLPNYDQVGGRKKNKTVGIFYYIWHGAHGNKVYDVTKILKENNKNPQWGPVKAYHFWGEPEYGYFCSIDPFVIRHDLQMLSNADIDFMFFDTTNGVTYLDVVNKICEISQEMRRQGTRTPQICFATNARSGKTMNILYDKFYSQTKYHDLWFYWDGKPLILGRATDPELRNDVKDFFNIKFSWAWTNAKKQANHWQWLDHYPQDYGWSVSPEIPEQITVSTAQHPTSSIGKSYHNGKEPKVNKNYVTKHTHEGLYFEEQWRRAHEVNPQVVMVTQWNEWIAMRFVTEKKKEKMMFAGRKTKIGKSFFVDTFTQEFNRDIAPMKKGHTDNYYYQLIAHVRAYKGVDKPQAYSVNSAIEIDASFADWKNVTPVFLDHKGDIVHRDFKGYDPTTRYTNYSGRNDIVESRVSYDNSNLYFYVRTNSNLTNHKDKNWMLLYIDVDQNKKTGWEGYDYVINKEVHSNNITVVSKWNRSSWTKVGEIKYAYSQNEMELCLPLSCISMDENIKPNFDFHWIDNQQYFQDVSAFSLDGDSAPDRRFNYRY